MVFVSAAAVRVALCVRGSTGSCMDGNCGTRNSGVASHGNNNEVRIGGGLIIGKVDGIVSVIVWIVVAV